MILEPVFERFLAHSPLSVMARATIEHALAPETLDALFKQTAQRGYTKELLFSTTVDLMSLVVCGQASHVSTAFARMRDRIPVTLKSVYDKLTHIETVVSTALVRTVATRCVAVIDELGGACRGLLPEPYRAKILDGSHLAATQKRLKVTRGHSAAPLPAMSVVVLDPARMVMTDVISSEDGYTNERALIDQVVPRVRDHEVWIADRIFCTFGFLTGVIEHAAFFVVRRHGLLPYLPHGEFTPEVATERGFVGERPVRIAVAGQPLLAARLVVVRLHQPTEDGEEEVEILTNLPAEVADAACVSQLYLRRWQIEGAFHELAMALHGELNTLGYPKAAVFGFAVAVAAYNVLAVLKAALRAVHGEEKVRTEVSGYHIAVQWSMVYPGMMVALPAAVWEPFGQVSSGELAGYLREWAGRVDLRTIRKSPPRKPTQHPSPRIKDRKVHISTYQLLEAAKQRRRSQRTASHKPRNTP
jgi:hypothetical protein